MKSGAHTEKHNARRLVARRPSFASGADGYIILYASALWYSERADVTHKKCPSMSTSFISLCIHKIMHRAASWQLRNFNGRRVKMTRGSFSIFSYINIWLSRSFKNLVPKNFPKKSEIYQPIEQRIALWKKGSKFKKKTFLSNSSYWNSWHRSFFYCTDIFFLAPVRTESHVRNIQILRVSAPCERARRQAWKIMLTRRNIFTIF
jgi:hypothetical protein